MYCGFSEQVWEGKLVRSSPCFPSLREMRLPTEFLLLAS
jgi:hypothetical protein